MTHYRVAVIQTPDSPDVDILMAPYDENRSVEPYISLTRDEVIERGREKISEVRERLGEIPDSDYWRQFAALDGADDEAVYRQMADYYGNDADEEGNLLSTYNPDSKWDYYTVIEKVSFVDWLASGADESDEELRAEWDKLSVEGDGFWRNTYYLEEYGDADTYIASCRTPACWAVLTPDGTWHEPGRVGWFGSDDATVESRRAWLDSFHKTCVEPFDPATTRVVILDCHI